MRNPVLNSNSGTLPNKSNVMVVVEDARLIISGKEARKLLSDSDITDVDKNFMEWIELLNKIDENQPDAKINATSMDDNNGGRIVF